MLKAAIAVVWVVANLVVIPLMVRSAWRVFHRTKEEPLWSDRRLHELMIYVLLLMFMNVLWAIGIAVANG